MNSRPRSAPPNTTIFRQYRFAFWMLILIVIFHGVFAIVAYTGLPERIPIHFNASGQADGFSQPGFVSWFLLWLISAGMATLIASTAQIMHRIPVEYINIPKKEAFLTLPEESRMRIFVTLKIHLTFLACVLALFFFLLHVFIYLAAVGKVDALPSSLLWGGTVAMVLYGFSLWFISNSSIAKELQSHQKHVIR